MTVELFSIYLCLFCVCFVFCIKGASGKVIVDDKGIKDSWREFMEKSMNEENEWDHMISAEVKKGPADCIRTA